jgi:ABC-type sugar transport system permease subunit
MDTTRRRTDHGWIAAAIGPALILLLVTAYLPILYALTLAFYEKSAFSPDTRWVGLDNFRWLFRQKDLWGALGRSVVFTLGAVSFQLAFGLFFGLLLNQAIRGRTIMRSLVILPYLLPTIVSAWSSAGSSIRNSASSTRSCCRAASWRGRSTSSAGSMPQCRRSS